MCRAILDEAARPEAADDRKDEETLDGSISRERLIQEGIEELREGGAEGFSLRRVARRCGVSCAAPYKHFKDKGALLRAIAMQYNDRWHAMLAEVMAASDGDMTRLMQAVCKAYLRFLKDNPTFCVLATQMDAEASKWHLAHLVEGDGSPTGALLMAYSREHYITPEAARLKISLLRGQLFGIAMMVGAGELPLTEDSMERIYRELNGAFLS